ncbi:hypothetical protein CVT25_015018 [Psilocybe cyanescens]|uniref:NADH:flavin oxidoreductase/NADH oxidase N-terminal domain-containing protein n=1 Tax=Psilocybe cyanescens TaxID=93625 RepID=A0A409X8R2_PSICY|nr:hypothetical protein CVT25_015018 [Psilocybe cyanescens]
MPYNSLFSPLKIGYNMTKNRIFMAALTRDRAKDSIPSELMKEYYVQRVSAGMIVTEAIMISPQGGEWGSAPGIWNDTQVARWKNIVDSVHEAGGIIYAQFWHGGRALHPDAPLQKLSGLPVYAPSAIKARGGKFRALPGTPGYVTVRLYTARQYNQRLNQFGDFEKPTEIDDPQILIDQFKHAALNAKKAGFDGIELHCGNGYLIHTFLDYTSNKRTDRWGGSIENRSRFGLEVIKVLIEVFGSNIGVKLTPCGGVNDMGMPLEDTISTFSYFITEVDRLDIAYIVLRRYQSASDTFYNGVSRSTKHDVLESYGTLIKHSKLVVNGGVTADEGDALISSGKVDAISIGLKWIPHPDLAKRIENEKPLDNVLDVTYLYGNHTHADYHIGYTDYPEAVY